MTQGAYLALASAGTDSLLGPLVVAACMVTPRAERALRALGPGEGWPQHPRSLTRKLQAICPHEVVRVGPPRYRELEGKLEGLRGVEAWAHGKALAGLLRAYPDCDHARVANLEGMDLEEALPELGGALELLPIQAWAEEPGAWAARMLARFTYLRALAKLSEKAGMDLPADPGPELDRALELLSRRGPGIMRQLAKGSPAPPGPDEPRDG